MVGRTLDSSAKAENFPKVLPSPAGLMATLFECDRGRNRKLQVVDQGGVPVYPWVERQAEISSCALRISRIDLLPVLANKSSFSPRVESQLTYMTSGDLPNKRGQTPRPFRFVFARYQYLGGQDPFFLANADKRGILPNVIDSLRISRGEVSAGRCFPFKP